MKNIVTLMFLLITLVLSGCIDKSTNVNPENMVTTENLNIPSETITDIVVPTPTPSVPIDENWLRGFISIVNRERHVNFTNDLGTSMKLNMISRERFYKMSEKPYISHYGSKVNLYTQYGEEVLFPEGLTPEEYVRELKTKAPAHWEMLTSPSITNYGFYIQEGTTYGVYKPCKVTEIPSEGINVKEYFESNGCEITEIKSTWVVLEFE